ncbi:MAG: hypothetical protein WCH85_08135 [Methanomicrobiales archaeon]
MRQVGSGSIEIIAGNFSDTINTSSSWAKYNITNLDVFSNSYQISTCETGCNT